MAASTTTNKNKKWQKEEEELLWKLFNEGQSLNDIATTLKRTVGAVKSRKDMLTARESKSNNDTVDTVKVQPNKSDIDTQNETESETEMETDTLKEDEKRQSENTETENPTDSSSDSVPGWHRMVFTQMEVKVVKSGTVWVNEESWNSNERKYNLKGTSYDGMRWKFTEKDESTGMGGLEAMALKIRNLEQQLEAQEMELESLRKMRDLQMELNMKSMQNLSMNVDKDTK